jgi:hypothetical protein
MEMVVSIVLQCVAIDGTVRSIEIDFEMDGCGERREGEATSGRKEEARDAG